MLRGLNVSEGTAQLVRKLVRAVPAVEAACMEADESLAALEADFRCVSVCVGGGVEGGGGGWAARAAA